MFHLQNNLANSLSEPLCRIFKNRFSFSVVDADTREGIKGVVFSLQKNQMIIGVSTSNELGIVTFQTIDCGNYILRELNHLAEYKISNQTYHVNVHYHHVLIDGVVSKSFLVLKDSLEKKSILISYLKDKSGNEPFLSMQSDGEAYMILNNIFQTDHQFSNWNTSFDNSGLSYVPETNHILREDLTLYAIWKSQPPKILSIDKEKKIINGFGLNKADIKIVFPNGTVLFTKVNKENLWSISFPEEVFSLSSTDVLSISQTEEFCLESDIVTSYVNSSLNDFEEKIVEELDVNDV